MSDTILDEVREILQKSPTTSFGQGYVIGLVAELEATQGVLSRVQEARADDIARADKAEAENARQIKMVDWLAGQLHGLGPKYGDVICPQEKCHATHDCIDCWKEAARRAVDDSEVKG